MRPFSIYYLSQGALTFFQKKLVALIIEAANPEMIFLLGASLYRRRSESIFNEPAPSSTYFSDCFLLVLMQETIPGGLHEWQSKIEECCKSLMPVTALVLRAETFGQWLKSGHPFALKVWHSGAKIHDSGNLPWNVQSDSSDLLPNKALKHSFTQGLQMAEGFLAGSELCRLRNQNTIAAFMLHQSAEQALITLIKSGTGYHPNTHNIERLLRYAGLVSYRIPDVFSQGNEQDRRLLSLLQKAYIDRHYKICNDDLLHLINKIRHLHGILLKTGENIFNT